MVVVAVVVEDGTVVVGVAGVEAIGTMEGRIVEGATRTIRAPRIMARIHKIRTEMTEVVGTEDTEAVEETTINNPQRIHPGHRTSLRHPRRPRNSMVVTEATVADHLLAVHQHQATGDMVQVVVAPLLHAGVRQVMVLMVKDKDKVVMEDMERMATQQDMEMPEDMGLTTVDMEDMAVAQRMDLIKVVAEEPLLTMPLHADEDEAGNTVQTSFYNILTVSLLI